MGQIVLVYGKSGSGKSRSLKGFAEDEIFLVNVEKKLLPFRGNFKYKLETDNIQLIMQQLAKMPMNIAVIDDAGYLLTNNFMRRHSSGLKGGAVYELYNDLADSFWMLFKFIKDSLPTETIVYILMHEDTSDNGITKLKTIGRLLDDKVCLEGMVAICLRCVSEEGKHYFRTATNGYDITKTPEDMFSDESIPNDLKMVDGAIREYYGWNAADTKEDENAEA